MEVDHAIEFSEQNLTKTTRMTSQTTMFPHDISIERMMNGICLFFKIKFV